MLPVMIALLPAVPARSATIAYVSIKNFAFSPATVWVKPGWEVRWTNGGSTGHTVTTDAGAPEEFNSETIQPTSSYQRAFSTIGTYDYRCTIHPGMRGKVIVRTTDVPPPPSPTPSPTPTPKKSATPSASPTPARTRSPSSTPSASKSPSVSPSPKPAQTKAPSVSPSPSLVAAPKDGGGSGAPVALALVVLLGGISVLVYQRFTHGT